MKSKSNKDIKGGLEQPIYGIKASGNHAANLNLEQMLRDIDGIVSGDWGYSVTDEMVNLQDGTLREFTQEQAEEMSHAIGRVYMIAHAVDCVACGAKYRVTDVKPSDSKPSKRHDKSPQTNHNIGG